MAASAAVFGFSLVAQAQYPPPAVAISVDDPTPAPGQTITVTFQGCTPGETVNFVLVASNSAGQCSAAAAGLSLLMQAPVSGTATGQLTAPTAPGTYTGSATGATSGQTASFTVTVSQAAAPPGGLPATGSGGISTLNMIAIGLLVIGAGLFAVSQIRRRQATT
jgi:hypothetical protein